jgi:hypothetical protein
MEHCFLSEQASLKALAQCLAESFAKSLGFSGEFKVFGLKPVHRQLELSLRAIYIVHISLLRLVIVSGKSLFRMGMA